MIWKILGTILLSLCAGALYRLGGWEKGNKAYRRFGVPTAATAALLLWYWQYLYLMLIVAIVLHFGALCGTLTTYVGKKKGGDATLLTWILTGLCYSLCALPIAWITGHWVGFSARVVVLTVLTALESQLIGRDWVEEGLRGSLIVITAPLLLI